LTVYDSKRLQTAALACILAIALHSGPARAQDDSLQSEAGTGALAAVSTLLYGPTKVVYAGMGLVFGGIAWGLSGGDGEVMRAVVTPSVRGDYVVTPNHLRGERALEFFGRTPGYRTDRGVAAAPDEDF
jgi:hypothetical protein